MPRDSNIDRRHFLDSDTLCRDIARILMISAVHGTQFSST